MKPNRFKGLVFPLVILFSMCVTSLVPYLYAISVPRRNPVVFAPTPVVEVKKPSIAEKPRTNIASKPKPKPKLAQRPKSLPNRLLSGGEIDDLINDIDLGRFDSEMVRSVIYYESRFHTGLVSHRNAIGLMGIRATTETGKDVWLKQLVRAGIIKTEADLFRPANNIRAGVFILNTFYDLHDGDMKKVLKSYTGSSTLAKKYTKGVPDDGRE